MKKYLIGNTIRFKCVFYDFDKNKVDPSIVKLTIYDGSYKKVDEYILGANNKESKGTYFYDIVAAQAESGSKGFYYEFYGEIDGSPSINRGAYQVTFI